MDNRTNFMLVGEFHQAFGHPKPDTVQYNVVTENPDLVKLRIALIDEELKEIKDAIKDNNMVEIADGLGDLLYVVYGMGQAFGIDLDKVFKIVHESNMSKLCKTENEAIETIAHYKTLAGFENTNVKYRIAPDQKHYVIYNADTGKILKSKYFQPPNLLL